jgi:hypothetical protein
MGTSYHFRYSGGGWRDRHDLPGGELLLHFWIIGIGSTIDVVVLLVSFCEISFWVFQLLLLIDLFGRLEDLICKALQSVVVPSLVLSLEVENKDPVQEIFKLPQPGPVLLVAMWPLYIYHGVI